MSNNLWMDAEASRGISNFMKSDADEQRLKFFEVLNSNIIRDYFKTDMECPCDSCLNVEACAHNSTECSAFRNWCTRGKYKLEQVQKNLKVPPELME